MIVISESNEEVKNLVPGAKEIEIWVDIRQNDAAFARFTGKFLLRACKKYIIPLVGEYTKTAIIHLCPKLLCKEVISDSLCISRSKWLLLCCVWTHC